MFGVSTCIIALHLLPCPSWSIFLVPISWSKPSVVPCFHFALKIVLPLRNPFLELQCNKNSCMLIPNYLYISRDLGTQSNRFVLYLPGVLQWIVVSTLLFLPIYCMLLFFSSWKGLHNFHAPYNFVDVKTQLHIRHVRRAPVAHHGQLVTRWTHVVEITCCLDYQPCLE